MANKKNASVLEVVPDEVDAFEEPEDIHQVEETVKADSSIKHEDASKPVFWTETTWAGVKPVLKCAQCGEFRDSNDDMIMHVVSHYPEDQQNQIFDQLVILARPRGELAGLTTNVRE